MNVARLRADPRVRTGTVLAVALLGLVAAGSWWAWNTGDASSPAPDVVVAADGPAWQARDDIARRLRQRGWNAEVVETPQCAGLDSLPTARNVIRACGASVARFALIGTPSRPAMPCQWWDTPGSGEARPGLGQCRANGTVVVWADGALTPAGMERMARSIVAELE